MEKNGIIKMLLDIKQRQYKQSLIYEGLINLNLQKNFWATNKITLYLC